MGSSVRKGKAVLLDQTQVKSFQSCRTGEAALHNGAQEDVKTDNKSLRRNGKSVNGNIDLKLTVLNYIDTNTAIVFSETTCSRCSKVKEILDSVGVSYVSVELDKLENGKELKGVLTELAMAVTVAPFVFANQKFVGSYESIVKADYDGKLDKLFEMSLDDQKEDSYDFDLIVIGGGSGGLATAKEAVKYQQHVLVLDYVTPSPIGTKWGLGGTCVNVGCIPKKLMHQTALLGQALQDSRKYGWKVEENVQHSWDMMTEAVKNYISSLNWGYRVALIENSIKYENGYGEFVGPHKIKSTNSRGTVKFHTAKRFLIATGERPRYPGIPGDKEYCITSDDLFSLSYCPGKTLVVGASYVALECAGFLAGLGLNVTVMVRSILLRGFDQEMADKIGEYMEGHGVKFIRNCVPTKIEQLEPGEPGTLKVTAKSPDGTEITEEYNTVLLAIGRDACTRKIGLDTVGVKINEKTGKIPVNDEEQTNVPYIYAIGDVLEDKLELTPVAIQAGRLLARRLYGGSTLKCDYVNVPTTVFTPMEYGACGLSEESAVQKYGENSIEVYHGYFWPLEWTVPGRDDGKCYAKVICNKKDQERVLGFHVLAPNAGEITQGFAVAMKCGVTKEQLDSTVGIHPVCAEIFTTLSVTKSSGEEFQQSGC